MTRSISEFQVAEFVHIGKVIIANVANPMKVLMPACQAILALVAWESYRKKQRGSLFMWVALALLVATLLITLLVEVPIDNQIKTWTGNNAPGNWQAIREKWARFHEWRTFTSLGSFITFGIGSLVGETVPNHPQGPGAVNTGP